MIKITTSSDVYLNFKPFITYGINDTIPKEECDFPNFKCDIVLVNSGTSLINGLTKQFRANARHNGNAITRKKAKRLAVLSIYSYAKQTPDEQ